MKSARSSARDRLFVLCSSKIEQILCCDESDDEEKMLHLENEDIALLEQDADATEGLPDDNFVEVVIENGKSQSLKVPPPKRQRKEKEAAAPVAEPVPSTSSAASVSEQPSTFQLPKKPVFHFCRVKTYTQPGLHSDYEHSKLCKKFRHRP